MYYITFKMSQQRRIQVCVVGLGNCATSLITGVVKYSKDKSMNGISYESIGDYTVDSLDFVLAFDVDKRKVGKSISEALQQRPNCTPLLCSKEELESSHNVCGKVYKGPVLDGVADHMKDYPESNSFRVSEEAALDEAEIKVLLRAHEVDVIVNYLPVGSQHAVEFWANICLETKIPMMNCIPVFIASDPVWAQKFRDANLPIIGDDIRSQFGASILSSAIQSLLLSRGLKVNAHIQQNFGGNTDFLNMMDKSRLTSKKISKENVIKNEFTLAEQAQGDCFVFAGPSDYIAHYEDNKIAYIRIEAENFGGQPITLDCKLSVLDSPNSAGIVIDSIRFLKLGHDLGMKGPMIEPSAIYCKTPPIPLKYEDAKENCDELAKTKVVTKLYEGYD
jgi:myo-inositol-1-phosphate synthase